jgi:hypothetical protein
MKHFLAMTLFAFVVSLAFGAISRNNMRERVLGGLKVFGEFMGVGIVLAWVLYFLP